MSFLGRGLRWVFRVLLGRFGKLIATPIRRRLFAFEAATHDPRTLQQALLERILRNQAETGYGRDHRFSDIRTLEDFRRQVPIAGYEGVESYIDRMRKGDFKALVADNVVHMFALTSGTTSSRKYIPVTDQYLADYKRGWNIWGLKVFRDHPETKLRPILQVSGDWNECQTEAGTPCGAVTGLTARMQIRLIRWLYCVPAAVGEIKDVNAKYYLIMRLSLPRSVAMLIAANPSTLINLARAGDRDKETLIRAIYDGTLSEPYPIPPHVREAVRSRIKKNKARAKELEEIVSRTGTLYPKDYWPKDCILGNWTGGSMGAYLRHYPKYFGATPVRDVGLIASEGRMTIPLSDATPAGVLDITSHYFEFIPEEEGDSPNPTVLRADELIEGRHYYILPTTAFGLYRYHIRDVVRCAGFHNKTPLIEFLSKGSHFANLTGEKLSEYHVTQAMKTILHDLDLPLSSYSLAPCWPSGGEDELTPYYGLFVERPDLVSADQGLKLAQMLDRKLSELNIEYAAKRESLRLGSVRLQLLPGGTWHEWDRSRLARTGGSAEQYKHPCLIADPKFRESMPVEQELTGALNMS
jgi:hypothetical protein